MSCCGARQVDKPIYSRSPRGERGLKLYGAYQLTKILPVSLEELAQAVAEEKDNKTGCKASEKEG